MEMVMELDGKQFILYEKERHRMRVDPSANNSMEKGNKQRYSYTAYTGSGKIKYQIMNNIKIICVSKTGGILYEN
jgi:hypothetical protein